MRSAAPCIFGIPEIPATGGAILKPLQHASKFGRISLLAQLDAGGAAQDGRRIQIWMHLAGGWACICVPNTDSRAQVAQGAARVPKFSGASASRVSSFWTPYWCCWWSPPQRLCADEIRTHTKKPARRLEHAWLIGRPSIQALQRTYQEIWYVETSRARDTRRSPFCGHRTSAWLPRVGVGGLQCLAGALA